MPRTPAPPMLEELKRLFRSGKTNADVLASYKRRHPHSSYTVSTINWFRNKLRAEGYRIPSERECRN